MTTYDIVRNNSKSLRGDNYFIDESSDNDATWDYMILDEVDYHAIYRFRSLLTFMSELLFYT